VQSAAGRVAAELGGADLLFNNAGVMLFAPIEAPTTDQWQRAVDVNIGGLNNAVAAFTPQLVVDIDVPLAPPRLCVRPGSNAWRMSRYTFAVQRRSGRRPAYRGAIRSAPSIRMVSPLR
jgi:NAD(P)-dependent dehydrogenase (short-subunit alcohol dehydrogenase family)